MSNETGRNRRRRNQLGRGLCIWLAVLLGVPAAAAQAHAPDPAYLTPRPLSRTTYQLDVLASGIYAPVDAVPLDDTGAVLVVTLDGTVMRYQDGEVDPRPFLSLTGRVTGLLGEQGLFSIALEPAKHAAALGGPRHLIAAFTEAGTNDLLVAAYPLLADLSGALWGAESIILRQAVPEPFHHGGQVAFGPDGLLYVSIGDGQREVAYLHVQPHVAQDLRSLRGKVLRIDPFTGGANRAYTVPADNPFTAQSDPKAASAGARGEIWAYGFRNPWKFSFAASDGALLLSDVGEDRWEEIDVVVRGGNYGWPAREGPECLLHLEDGSPVAPDCEELDLVAPAASYGHPAIDPSGGFSVTGGVEVIDPTLPSLVGKYVFGDFVTGRMWTLDRATSEVNLIMQGVGAISSFANDSSGALLVTLIDGTLARIREVH